ncbi:MAG: hypothetical protein ACRC31_06640 [Cetobacterium sp.]
MEYSEREKIIRYLNRLMEKHKKEVENNLEYKRYQDVVEVKYRIHVIKYIIDYALSMDQYSLSREINDMYKYYKQKLGDTLISSDLRETTQLYIQMNTIKNIYEHINKKICKDN